MRMIYPAVALWLHLVLFPGAFNPLLAGSLVDNKPPEIIATSPEGNTSGVDINSSISVTISEGMNPLTLNADMIHLYKLEGPEDIAIQGKVKYDVKTKTAYFIPDNDLSPATNYKVVIGKDLDDTAGGALKDVYSWEFSTRISTGGCGGS